MRKEFEMTQEEHDAILEACKPVPYMVIGGVEPRSQQESANDAWEALGRKYGFKGMSVAPVAHKSSLFFTAEIDE